MPRIKWNSDKVLSLAAMFISLLTLIFFIYQTNLMSRQNSLSIMPYLSVSTSSNPDRAMFELKLVNHGVGPAILERVRMIKGEKEYDLADFGDLIFPFLQSVSGELDSVSVTTYATLGKGTAIPANTAYTLFGIYEDEAAFQRITSAIDRLEAEGLDYEIVYKSIQDEFWRISDSTNGPVRID